MVLCACVDYWAYPYGIASDSRRFNRGENGLWLRYTWYFGQHSTAEARQLAQQLHARQIRYAYFHVRHVNSQGRLVFRYPDAAKTLMQLLHRESPGVRCIAWMDAFDLQTGQAVPLANADTRRRMVQEAVWLVQTCGFDGVQWDYEPCANGDANLLALLRETKAALPPGRLLSVATPVWLPEGLRRWGWSDAYFAQVAAVCDQMAVMCYDTGFYFPRCYVWLIRQQAIHVTRAAANGNPQCRVLLGVPTYGTGLPSHNPRAENITLALQGVREGLSDSNAEPSAFAGVAIFADYTTSQEAWNTYQAQWLTPSR